MENETVGSQFLWNAYYPAASIYFYVFFGTIYISVCKQNICALEELGHPDSNFKRKQNNPDSIFLGKNLILCLTSHKKELLAASWLQYVDTFIVVRNCILPWEVRGFITDSLEKIANYFVTK